MIWKRIKLPRWPLPRISLQRPNRAVVKKMLLVGLLLVALAGAFYLGRHGGLSEARGQQAPGAPLLDPTIRPAGSGEYSRRVVAYIYGSIPITREDFGEYLIDRVGAERVDFLVNRRIIEVACRQRNINITPEEIQAQLAEDLKGFQCTERQFATDVLSRYKKTLFEWKEDVIRPKLALQRLVQDKITIGEEDLQKGFEAKYGEKVDCRIIVLTKEQRAKQFDIYEEAKKEFERVAKAQAIGPLAAKAGQVPPIHKHFEDPNIEKEAFKLRPGEVSPLIGMPDGTTVILMCEKRIAADTTKRMDQERESLYKELSELRLATEIPKVFQTLRTEANPQIFLRRESPPPSGPVPPAASAPQPVLPTTQVPSAPPASGQPPAAPPQTSQQPTAGANSIDLPLPPSAPKVP